MKRTNNYSTINLHQTKGSTSTTWHVSNNTTVNRGNNRTNTKYNGTGTEVETIVKRCKK